MKSSFSKITTSLALFTACGALNSCRIFGDHQYASQMEVETDVPDSLEQGKPSTGPAAGNAGAYPANYGVPVSSNLTEIADPGVPSSDYSALPGSPSTATSVPAGGASLTSLPADTSRALIDIPKPEFTNISVHNTRPPAEMLSLGPPLKPVTRMSLGHPPPAGVTTPGIVQEKIEPLSAAAPSSPNSEIASASKELKSPPAPATPAEPGVPLLLSGARLSDFYQSLHQPLLDSPVVENSLPADTAPPAAPDTSADALAVPPPPPADDTPAPPPTE